MNDIKFDRNENIYGFDRKIIIRNSESSFKSYVKGHGSLTA